MKKLLILAILSVLVAGCTLKKTDETKTTGEYEPTTQEQMSQDDSLESIEGDLEATTIEDFEQ